MSEQDDMPFGENITNPDSTTIPPGFHGRWCHSGTLDHMIEADTIVFGNETEQVVAVRFIDYYDERVGDLLMSADPKDRIAIVTRHSDGVYSLHYRGLSADGAKLVDLESMDMKFDRC